MNTIFQPDLFAPKIVETPWRPGERRRLRGNVGTAIVEIDVLYNGQFFYWSGHFHAPTFGTSAPQSGQQFSSAGSAFGAVTGFFRSWLDRNGQSDWRKRFDRWLESKTLSDFQRIDLPPNDNANANTRDRAGDLPPLRT